MVEISVSGHSDSRSGKWVRSSRGEEVLPAHIRSVGGYALNTNTLRVGCKFSLCNSITISAQIAAVGLCVVTAEAVGLVKSYTASILEEEA